MPATDPGRSADHWLTSARRGGSVAVLALGESGTGQLEFARMITSKVRTHRDELLTIWSTQGAPPLMAVLQLANLLGIEDIDHAETLALTRRLRARIREYGPKDAALVLCIYGFEELPEPDRVVLLDLVLGAPRPQMLTFITASTRRLSGEIWPEALNLRMLFEDHSRGYVAELTALSLDDATTYIEDRLHPEFASPRCLREVHERTGGRLDDIAGLVDVIAHLSGKPRGEILSGSTGLDVLAVPDRVRARTEFRLQGLDDTTKLVAHALAVHHLPLDPSTLGKLTGLSPETLEEALATLEYRGLAHARTDSDGRIKCLFDEPLVEQAVYQSIPLLTRRRLHAKSAELSEPTIPASDATEEGIALARHYIRGGLPMDHARIARVGTAAQALVARSRYSAARELLSDLFLSLRSEDDEPADIWSVVPPSLMTLIAEIFSRSGEWDAAHEILERAEATGSDTAQYIAAMIRSARDHVALGRDREALEVYHAVLASAEKLDAVTHIQVLMDSARVLHTLGHTEEALTQIEDGARRADTSGSLRLASEAERRWHSLLLMCGRSADCLQHARRSYQFARRSQHPRTIARATSTVGNALLDGVSLPRGSRWLQKAYRLAEQNEDYATVSGAGLRLAAALTEMGQWDDAERFASRVLQIDSSMNRLRSLPRSRAALSLLRIWRGEPNAGTALWQHGDQLDMGYALSAEATARFEHEMAHNDADAARHTIAQPIEWFQDLGGRERLLIHELLPRKLRAEIQSGSLDRAEATFAEMMSVVEANGGQLRIARAELLLAEALLQKARGQWDDATANLEWVASEYAASGHAWREARALEELADAFIRAGAAELAIQPLAACQSVYTATRSVRIERLRPMYRAAGHRIPRRSNVLSEREREVMQLASDGLSDAEIGVALGVSRRTATTHMHNILSKLGLRSRVELRPR